MATISTEPTNFIDTLSQNAITLGIAIYLIVIAYYMTKDPEKLFTNIYLYSTIAIVPIIIGLVYLLKNSFVSCSRHMTPNLSWKYVFRA